MIHLPIKFYALLAAVPFTRNSVFIAAMSTSFDHYSAHYGQVGGNDSSNNKNSRAAVVFLHGLGDNSEGWSSLEQMLPAICPRLGSDSIHYAFPQAPVIGITLNGGGRVPGWFDLYDWPIDTTSRDDHIGQLKAVNMLEETIEKIEREEGIPASRIVVGGFAQGGALAMLSAYSR